MLCYDCKFSDLHNELCDLHNELLELTKWPSENIIPLKKIEEAGFIYTYYKDVVLCPFCKLKLYKWEENDDPMQLHIKYKPNCPIFNKIKNEQQTTNNEKIESN